MSDDISYRDAVERAERVLGKVYVAEKEREEKEREEKEELDRVSSLRHFQRVRYPTKKPLSSTAITASTTKRNRNFRKEDFHSNEEEHYNDDGEEEDDAISISSQVSCLTMPQLQDKLRTSQITLMKLKENSTLKYLRLQQEHNRLKDSLPTLECKVSDAKALTQQILKQRDEAYRRINPQQQRKKRQDDKIIKRIADENETLRLKLQQLKQTSVKFLMERDQYSRMVESCTCRGTELEDVADDDNDQQQQQKMSKNRRDILQRRQSTRTKQGYGPPSYTKRNGGHNHSTRTNSISSNLTRKNSDQTIDWDKDGYLY